MTTIQGMLAEIDAQVPRIRPEEAKGMVGCADSTSSAHDKVFDPAKTVVTYCASGGRAAALPRLRPFSVF